VEADPHLADLSRIRSPSQPDESVHLPTEAPGAIAQRDLDGPVSRVRFELIEETQGVFININVDANTAFPDLIWVSLNTIDQVLEAHRPVYGRK